MKTVIATLLAKPRKKFEDVDYFVGFHHLCESLRRHNRSLPPILVFSPDIKSIPPGADQLVQIEERDFDGIEHVQMSFGKSVYFKLALFRLNELGIDADRVIYFDTDVLTFAPVDMLWDKNCFCDKDIYGIRESKQLGLLNPDWQGRLNAGVLVINRPMLSQKVFDSMIDLARSGKTYDHGDQGVINAWLTSHNHWDWVGELPVEFNVPSCIRTHGDWDNSDWDKYRDSIKAMHFVGPRKPWRTRPEHEWFHPDTQAMWDNEIAHHASLPTKGRPDLASSIHTRIVRVIQRYERWRGKEN